MSEDDLKSFTELELRKFDGRDGNPAYLAYKGMVIDVSGSPLWMHGKHMDRHSAGAELTASLSNAPHGEEVLTRYPFVGRIIPDDQGAEALGHLLRRLAPHPMIVHFPIAYSVIVPVLSLLYLVSGAYSFEVSSYYMLLLGFLSAPVCTLTGYVSWKMVYRGEKNRAFKTKIVYSVALICVITTCVVWRTLDPQVLTGEASLRYVYLGLLMMLAPITTILGHTGGKIVFP